MRRKEVWTSYRKLMANLVPALFFVPAFVGGILLYQRGHHAIGIGCMIIALVVGIFAVNRFGLFQNGQMMKELQPQPANAMFVGLGKPGSVGMLDPHDDIGWLTVHAGKLEFTGEKGHYEILKEHIIGVGFRPNVHSVLGLGRWVSVEAKRDGKSLRMLIEPRKHATHLQNRREGTRLLEVLKAWLNQA